MRKWGWLVMLALLLAAGIFFHYRNRVVPRTDAGAPEAPGKSPVDEAASGTPTPEVALLDKAWAGKATAPLSSQQFQIELGNLPATLSQIDRGLMRSWLEQSGPATYSREERIALVNDIMLVIRKQVPYQRENWESLLATAKNAALDEAVRDYAIQHLHGWLVEQNPAAPLPPEALVELEAVMVSLARQNTHTWSATALLTLVDLNQDAPKLDGLILELLNDAGTNALAKITLLQCAEERSLPEALPIARKILQETNDPSLRVGAFRIVAKLGNEEDRAALEELVKTDTSGRLRYVWDAVN